MRATLGFAVSSGLQRGLAFLLLPLFTRAVAPAEYGQLSIAVSVSAVAGILFACGLEPAVVRGHFQHEGDPVEQRRHLASIWSVLLIGPIVVATVASLVAWPILYGSSTLSPSHFALAMFAGAFSTAGATVPSALFRAEQRVRDSMILGGTSAILTTVGTTLLVVVLGLGVTAWLAAIAAANLLTVLLAFCLVPYPTRGGFDADMLKKALQLGIPLVPHFVSLWALRVADQFLLATMVPIAEVGIYSLAGSIAAPVGLLVTTLTGGFMPYYASAAKRPDRTQELSGIMSLELVIIAVITMAGAVLGPSIVDIVAAARYSDAAGLAPWLILGYGIMGAYYLPLSLLMLTHGRTKGVAVITLLGVVVNLLGVWLLVPPLGLMGAAAATPIGYAALLAGLCFYGRGGGVGINWPETLGVMAICTMAFVGAEFTAGISTSASQGAVRLIWVLAATVAIMLSAGDIRNAIAAIYRSRIRRGDTSGKGGG